MDSKTEVFRLAQGEFGVNGPDGHRVSAEETTRLRHVFEAAPEMLEALLAARHALRCIGKTIRDNDPELALINAAIRKATGGEQ